MVGIGTKPEIEVELNDCENNIAEILSQLSKVSMVEFDAKLQEVEAKLNLLLVERGDCVMILNEMEDYRQGDASKNVAKTLNVEIVLRRAKNSISHADINTRKAEVLKGMKEAMQHLNAVLAFYHGKTGSFVSAVRETTIILDSVITHPKEYTRKPLNVIRKEANFGIDEALILFRYGYATLGRQHTSEEAEQMKKELKRCAFINKIKC